ncbi:MAG TPA: response regulator [Magnetospirillaceae bacterium]|nr:response regulator [Magnetospirillaceae bacterium]
MRGPKHMLQTVFIVVAMVALAAVTVLGITAIDYARDGQSWVDHSQEVIGAERLLLAQLVDAETGVRGYLLTRNPIYLQSWTRAQQEAPAALQHLFDLTADNPEQQKTLTRLDVLIGRKFELNAQEIAELDKTGKVTDVDMSVMDTLRSLIAEIEKRERAIYDQRRHEMILRYDRLRQTLAATWLLSLAGLAFGGWSLRQSSRRVAEIEAVNRQARKMEAIGNLTGGIAHDFNNLLQVIIANLDLAFRQIGPKEPAAGFLQSALMALEKGERLTSQLLAFARRQPLNPQPIDIARMIEECGNLLRRTLGEAYPIECSTSAGLWRAMADSTLLQNAIVNLALNARDAMPDGGQLTIEASNVTLDSDYAEQAGDVSPGAYVLIAVSDSGMGMNKEALGRVFEPFYTTKETGTGLGLPMVYGFVKQSGGHIAIYSEPGQGTTVKLYLPRTTKAAAERDRARRAAARGQGQLILVVEDDDSVRAGVVAQLSDLGYGVLAAADGDTALALAQGNPQIDLLFTDVVLGGPYNGRQLADAIRALRPGLPVVYTSGYTENAIVHHGRLDQGVTLLSKPYRADQLASTVSDALHAIPAAGTASSSVSAAPIGGQQEDGLSTDEAEIVLLVDDNRLVRSSLAMMLEDLGYGVVEAETAEQALTLLGTAEQIDAALVDFRLPDMDGLELAGRLRGMKPDLRLVMVSGQPVGQAELARIPGPPVGMLLKPFNAAQLEDLLYASRPQH